MIYLVIIGIIVLVVSVYFISYTANEKHQFLKSYKKDMKKLKLVQDVTLNDNI